MESVYEFSVKFFKWLNPLGIYDFEYWVYVFTGCWTYKSPKQWKTTLYKTYQAFLAIIYGLVVAFYVMDAIAVSDDLEKLSFNLSSSFLVFVTIGKVFLLLKERDRLDDVYRKLNNHLDIKSIGASEEEKRILNRKAEILSTITMGFYTLMVLGLPLRVIADTTFDPKAYLIPIPYREMVDTYYEYIYAAETIIILHVLVVVLSHDLLVFSVLIRLIGHFEILAHNIQDIKTLYTKTNTKKEIIGDVLIHERNDREKLPKFLRNNAVDWIDSKVRERRAHLLLKETVRYHQILLRDTNTFCQLYSLPLLVQSCGAGILIALVILQIFFNRINPSSPPTTPAATKVGRLWEHSRKLLALEIISLQISKRMTTLLVEQIMFTVTLLWNIFFLCSFATELDTKSRMAANALYGIPWYEMDIKNRRIVQFAIKKMMEGPTLKGGNMIVVNRVTYLKFLRISYNVIAVLRHMY